MLRCKLQEVTILRRIGFTRCVPLSLRHYSNGSDETMDEATKPSPADTPSAPASAYTKRQNAHLSPDPEKHKHFLPRLSRKELGSFADEQFAREFADELELYPTISNKPLYDLRTSIPSIYEPGSTEIIDAIKNLKEKNPSINAVEVAEALGIEVPPEQEPPYAGARPILRWEDRYVMAVGGHEPHPLNKKAKMSVYLRDLQVETGLSNAALQHIARICGTRYNQNRGELTLVSEKYLHREENCHHIMKMVTDLIEEGKKLDGEGKKKIAKKVAKPRKAKVAKE